MFSKTWIAENTYQFKLIFFLLGLSLTSACHNDYIDPVYVNGTRQNLCMTLANDASEKNMECLLIKVLNRIVKKTQCG
jgi:uncharacterized membrane protein YczE